MSRIVTFILLAGAVVALSAAVLMRGRIGHPVTPLMSEAASAATGQTVAATLGLSPNRPTVVIFILPDCPCSEAYEPYSHQLHRAYLAGADFIGIVAGDEAETRAWQLKHNTPFPLIADPEHTIAREFGAKRSAYTALVRNGRTIDHLWPGYSIGMLTEVGAKLSAIANTKVQPLDLAGAPNSLTSGCAIDL